MVNSMVGPQKIKNRTTIRSSNSTSGCFPKKIKTLIKKDTCTPTFIAALFIIARIWKQSKCPLKDIWIKMCVCVCVYVYTNTHKYTHTTEYYSAMKKNEILPFVTTWMDLEGIILSEISQTERDKYCMISLICAI